MNESDGRAATSTSERPVDVEDLLRVRWPMEPSISRNGRRIAFVLAGLDADEDRLVHRIHLHDRATGVSTPVGSNGEGRRPRWSPDGRQLAFVSGAPGSTALSLLDAEGSHVATFSLPGEVTGFGWAPDGRALVCAVSEVVGDAVPRRPYPVRSRADLEAAPSDRTLWLVSTHGEPPHRLLPSGWGDTWGPAWSPDGSRIAFLGDPGTDVVGGAGVEIWTATPDGGELRRLVPADGLVTAVSWSPDGSELAYIGHVRGTTPGVNNEVWIADARSGKRRSITGSIDRSVGQVVRGDDERGIHPPVLAWASDGTGVLALFADGGASSLALFGDEGAHIVVAGGQRSVLEFDLAHDDDTVVFSWSDPTNPGELSVGNVDGRQDRRCTAINDRWCDGVRLAPTRQVIYRAEDGVEVEGWLTEPLEPSGVRAPLVVEVHGGPHYPVGWRFAMNAQRLAAQGCAVLRANPRGSQGYGSEFALGIHGDWGGQDYRDLMGLIDVSIDAAPLDPRRLAIMGESYGGFMVNWALTQTDRFTAAVSENGLCDLFAASASAERAGFWHHQMGGAPWERGPFYAERSPLTRAQQITTPLLLLGAELDPISQSEELFVALTVLGRDVAYVRVPDEGHWVNVLGRASQRIAKTVIVDEWLAQRLSPDRAGANA